MTLIKRIKEKKTWIIAFAGILALAVVVLGIVNPTNTAENALRRYVDSMKNYDVDAYAAVCYDANFSRSMTKQENVDNFAARVKQLSGYNGTNPSPLKDVTIKITDVSPCKSDEMRGRKDSLSVDYENAARIIAICDISFDVIRGDVVTKGSAEAVNVAGKWYVHKVAGLPTF